MEQTLNGVTPSRGLLDKRVSMEHFDLIRMAPSEALQPFVENYWIIVWDLTGRPAYTQTNLPHPSVNMAIDPQAETGIWGIQTGTWIYRLEGAGRIFGVKFRPGAFHAVYRRPVHELADRKIAIEDVFAQSGRTLERRLLAQNDPAGLSRDIEDMLLDAAPVLDSKARDAGNLVDIIAKTPEIMLIADLADYAGMSVRNLQRLFESRIGIGPKWVIDRYRMLAAVDALNKGTAVSLTGLSHDLGYFDQAHFTNRFRALTGYPPSHYKR